jgi:urea transport system ATP-binding protein
MSNTDYVLAVEDLTVSFDGFKAIDNLNLYVDKGELRVIIGPNGAGKTTLLDLICGKTKASGGRIRFKNEEMTEAAPSTRSCAPASVASSRRRRSTRT